MGWSLALGLLLLVGCRVAPSVEGFEAGLAGHPGQGQLLRDVPFVEQSPERCAQAALASVLAFHGRGVSARELAARTYVPALHGTPTFALVEEARRLGFVTRELEHAELAALLLWLDAGTPVITLRRPRAPLGASLHYDVLVGYDDADGWLVLHDGTRPFGVVSYERFTREWSGWGLVLLPRSAVAEAMQAEELARAGRSGEARRLYRDYLKRFPADLTAAFNLADLEGPEEARRIYEAILRLSPDDGPTLNNLADLLGRTEAGHARAERLLRRAIEVDPANASAYRQTLAEVRGRQPDALGR